MLYKDFITKREIRMYFNTVTNYRIGELFRKTRLHCDEVGINMFSQETVPTDIFCKYWGIDYKKFIKRIEEANEELQKI